MHGHAGSTRRRTALTFVALVAFVAGACAGPAGSGGVSDDPAADGVPRCEDVAPLAAPEDRYAPTPVYVGNEMPIEEVAAWAEQQPGFQELWIDRERNGWLTLAFSEDADARQAELDDRFPDDGVVAVEVDWTMEELLAIQTRVMDRFADDGVGSGIWSSHGVVTVEFGVLTDERQAAVDEAFAGEPVCVSGGDPAAQPEPGPQPAEGDGWRLLADERTGETYRTGIATDDASYAELWEAIGLSGPQPDVEFDTEVVLWFGAVYGSGCDDLRLDDVVVDRERALVHADIVLLGAPAACPSDANPRAYVVAVARDRLPAGRFAIQLGAEDPPGGVPEERTVVDADLTVPGAVAGPDAIGPDPELLHGDPTVTRSGDVVETGYPSVYRLDARCGVAWLGELNGVVWRTDDPRVLDADDGVPAAWRDQVIEEGADRDLGHLDVEVLLEAGDPPTVTASAHGLDVVYAPAGGPPPPCTW